MRFGGGRFDGVFRTKGEFEIILCRFEGGLEAVKISQTKEQDELGLGVLGLMGLGEWGRGSLGRTKGPARGDYCFIAAKYDQLLGHKVHLDLIALFRLSRMGWIFSLLMRMILFWIIFRLSCGSL
jgi:hypothetical protein